MLTNKNIHKLFNVTKENMNMIKRVILNEYTSNTHNIETQSDTQSTCF